MDTFLDVQNLLSTLIPKARDVMDKFEFDSPGSCAAAIDESAKLIVEYAQYADSGVLQQLVSKTNDVAAHYIQSVIRSMKLGIASGESEDANIMEDTKHLSELISELF